jgi:lysyl-tRNA synthetase class 2
MMTVVENLLSYLSAKVLKEGKSIDGRIDFKTPYRRVRLTEIVAELTGWVYDGRPVQDVDHRYLWRFGEAGEMLKTAPPWYQLVRAYEHFVEPTLINPTFVTHFPVETMPLAKGSTEFPGFAEVFELAVNGMEVSPGYTEQNNPDIQYAAFLRQLAGHSTTTGELKDAIVNLDTEYLEAMRHGMPPAGGIGIGIDRLVMALLGQESIRDVILFPTMKPLTAANE